MDLNLKQYDMKGFWKNMAAIVTIIILLGIVGRMDYNEEVVYHMSNGTYELLKEKLGNVSTSELVDTYMSNKEYWDSLGQLK